MVLTTQTSEERDVSLLTDREEGPPITTIEAAIRPPVVDATRVFAAGKDDKNISPDNSPRKSRFGLARSYVALYSGTDWKLMSLALLTAIAAGVPIPIIAYLTGDIVNAFGSDFNAVKDKVWKMVVIALVFYILSWAYMALFSYIGLQNGVHMREEYVKSLLSAEVREVEGKGAAVSSKLGGSIHLVQSATGDKAGLLLQSISYFVTAFVVGFIRSATLTAILLPIVPVFLVIVTLGSHYTKKYTKRIDATTLISTTFAQEAFKNIRLLKTLNSQSILSDKFGETTAAAIRDSTLRAVCGAMMTGCIYFAIYLTNALAFWQGSRLVVSQDEAGAGNTYIVTSLIIDSAFVIGMVSPFLQIFGAAASTGDEIRREIEEARRSLAIGEAGSELGDEFNERITFENVSFSYPSSPETLVLDNFNLELGAGRLIGIVGQSGSCKSTLINLIERFYDVGAGRICIDGQDISELKRSSWRKHISLVSQEPVLFTGTIYENIAAGLARTTVEYSDQEMLELVKEAATQAHVASFVESLLDGYNTQVGSNGGSKLSIGQKQRITLARSLISEPRILLLDEATSAVDALSEKYIAEALRMPSKKSRTTVVIAHRLTTVKDADEIVVMHEGRVIEQGSHSALVAQGGKYAEMVSLQALANDEDDQSTKDQPDVSSDDSEKMSADLTVRDTEAKADICAEQLSTASVMHRIFDLCRPERVWIIAGLLSAFITGCITPADALLFGNLISTLNQIDRPDYLVARGTFLSAFFILVAGAALLGYSAMGSAFGISSIRLTQRIKMRVFRHLVDSPVTYYDDEANSADRVASRLDTDASALGGLSGQFIGSAFSVLTSILSGIILAHVVGPLIAVVLLPAVPVIILSGYLRLKVVAKQQRKNEEAFEASAGVASEAINNIKVVASLGLEHSIFQKYQKMLESTHKVTGKYMATSTALLALAYTVPFIINALAYLWGSYLLELGKYTTKDYFIVLPALLFSAQTSGQLFAMAPDFSRATIAAKAIFDTLAQKTEDLEGAASSHTESIAKGKIEFRNVSFKYPTRDSFVVEDLSFTIPAGKSVALVGRSGSGKTTLFSLLSRFYEPSSGVLLLDDVDIATLPLAHLRRQQCHVPQEPSVLTGSVRFNLQLADPAASDDAIEAACRAAEIWDFVDSLPDGLDTVLGGVDGVAMSGGQRQRLTIARSLLGRGNVVLLDEPTAALDAVNERRIDAALQAHSRGRTSIQIAHRLGGIVRSDLILVLDGGRVVESGTHAELSQRPGLYAELVACMM